MKILSDNGTEFQNKLFEQIAKELGVEYKLYTPPYHPPSNGRIEGFHAFLKACIAKHVAPQTRTKSKIFGKRHKYPFIGSFKKISMR